MDDWIEVFKAGKHTDSEGRTKTWSDSDLNSIVLASNGKQAPAVIGHPKTDGPAWGWVEAVKKEAGSVFVKFRDLVPEFKEMVKKKMFPNRSIALNSDFSIRHIGFLGAMPPAVKGLEDIKFSKDDPMAVIEFSQEKESVAFRFMEKMREFFSQEDNTHEGVYQPTKQTEGMAIKKPPKQKKESDMATFTEAQLDEKLVAQKAEFEEEKKKNQIVIEDLKSKADKVEKEAAKGTVTAFCDGLKKEGKLLPAWEKMGLKAFMLGLEDVSAEIEFSEGKKETQSAFFKRFLSEMPKGIEFSEIAKAGVNANASSGTHITGPVDQERLEFHNKAIEFQRQNKDVTYIDAFKAVGGV